MAVAANRTRLRFGEGSAVAVDLVDSDADDRVTVKRLRSDPGVRVLDLGPSMIRELQSLVPAPTCNELAEPLHWMFYPWRRTLVSVLGPVSFSRLRLDRNRNKISSAEQARLAQLKIGVVGLSVGHVIAHTLAVEGLCGGLRLADFDTIELSNLNRIPASILDVGVNKALVATRRIAEIDPYLKVETFVEGLTEQSMSAFLDGLDLVIEECDSLDIKVRVRQEARARKIPVLMDTSDRGLFDVERFDLEPDRLLFHGLLGAVDSASLAGLSTRDKAPHVMRILQAAELSARMAASMVEIDNTVRSWPQLGGDVQLGAATVAAAVRRFGRGDDLPSGRMRVDLDRQLGGIGLPSVSDASPMVDTDVEDLTFQIPQEPADAVIHAIRLAPSGGNSQPWLITRACDRVEIRLRTERTSAMDIGFRGSYVAIGAAGFNARVAAAEYSAVATVSAFPEGENADVVLTIDLGGAAKQDPANEEIANQYQAMVSRITNRNIGRRSSITQRVSRELLEAARVEGAALRLITDSGRMAEMADVLAESDRVRYLTPLLHQQLFSELRWPGRDRLDLGIDVRTLGLDPIDLAKLLVASRSDVMSLLASWGGGRALGDATRDRVNASSGLAVVTVRADTAVDYLHGGAAAERVWVSANLNGLDVQPISPVFLYARDDRDRYRLSADFATELALLQARFNRVVGLGRDEVPILVLRLSHAAGPAIRSGRLPLPAIVGHRSPLPAAAP